MLWMMTAQRWSQMCLTVNPPFLKSLPSLFSSLLLVSVVCLMALSLALVCLVFLFWNSQIECFILMDVHWENRKANSLVCKMVCWIHYRMYNHIGLARKTVQFVWSDKKFVFRLCWGSKSYDNPELILLFIHIMLIVRSSVLCEKWYLELWPSLTVHI